MSVTESWDFVEGESSTIGAHACKVADRLSGQSGVEPRGASVYVC